MVETTIEEPKDDKLLLQITDFKKRNKTVLDNWKKKLNEYRNLYRAKSDLKVMEGRSNVFVPELFGDIETVITNVSSFIFSDRIFFSASPMSPEREQYAKKIEILMSQMLDKIGFKRIFEKILRQSAIDGVVYAGLFWDSKKRVLPFYKGENGLEENKEINQEGILIETPDIVDVIFDVIQPIKDTGIIVVKCVDKNGLYDLKNEGIITEIPTDEESKDDNKEIKDLRMNSLGFGTPDESKKKGEYYIHNYWGDIDKELLTDDPNDKGQIISAHVLICNNKIIGKRQNPFWHQEIPYFQCAWLEMLYENLPISLSEINESLQRELNITRNQLIDHKNMTLYPVTLKDSKAGIKNSDMKIIPDFIIETDDMNGLKYLTPPPQAFNEGLAYENNVKNDMRNASAASNILQGISVSKRQTTGEVSLLQANSGSRIKPIATSIAETLLKPMLRQLYWLIQQYVDKEQFIKMIGIEGIEYQMLKPDEIYGELDFIPKCMTDLPNRQTIRQDLTQLIQYAGSLPPDSKLWGVVRKWYDTFGYKDTNEVIPTSSNESWKYHINPEKENELFEMGGSHDPYKYEDHKMHAQKHLEKRRELISKPQDEKTSKYLDILTEHIKKHLMSLGINPDEANQAAPAGQTPGNIPVPEQTAPVEQSGVPA